MNTEEPDKSSFPADEFSLEKLCDKNIAKLVALTQHRPEMWFGMQVGRKKIDLSQVLQFLKGVSLGLEISGADFKDPDHTCSMHEFIRWKYGFYESTSGIFNMIACGNWPELDLLGCFYRDYGERIAFIPTLAQKFAQAWSVSPQDQGYAFSSECIRQLKTNFPSAIVESPLSLRIPDFARVIVSFNFYRGISRIDLIVEIDNPTLQAVVEQKENTALTSKQYGFTYRLSDAALWADLDQTRFSYLRSGTLTEVPVNKNLWPAIFTELSQFLMDCMLPIAEDSHHCHPAVLTHLLRHPYEIYSGAIAHHIIKVNAIPPTDPVVQEIINNENLITPTPEIYSDDDHRIHIFGAGNQELLAEVLRGFP